MKTNRYIFGILFFFYSSVSMAQWVQENPYPGDTTDGVLSFAIGDTIYIGGGSSGAISFYKFVPSLDEWIQGANLPHPSGFCAGFAIGGKGYMTLGQSDPDGPGQTSVTNDLWEYDPGTDQWTQKANFPGTARDAAFAFVIGNKAYVGGGLEGNYEGDINSNFAVCNDFYSYDPSVDKWDTLQLLPDYLYFNSTFVLGNYGYIATGVENASEVSSLWKYDPSKDSWNQMADFPGLPRESGVGFALNGNGYVGLGQSEYITSFSDFYSYDPSADQWTPITAPFPGRYGEAWACAVSIANSAFLGIGTYVYEQGLIGYNDFWMFAPSAAVAMSSSRSDPNVYPNPTSSFITLSLPQNVASSRVIVQNSIGATCLTTQAGSGGHLDLSTLPAGIYNIEVSSDNYRTNVRVAKM
jgi:N-acetylneuraminic acid mutarotase